MLESRVKRLEVLQGGVMANTSERGMWQKSSRSIARSVRETRPPQRTWPCTTAQTVNRPGEYSIRGAVYTNTRLAASRCLAAHMNHS